MKAILLATIALGAGGYAACAAFLAWFTLAFFGTDWPSAVFAAFPAATIVPMLMYAADRWRRTVCGERVRV